MSADLILYALVAVVLVFWLRNTLGTRNGSERPPQSGKTLSDLEPPSARSPIDRGTVVDISDHNTADKMGIDSAPLRLETRKFPGLDIKGEAVPGLLEIMKYDRAFDPYKFIQGAKDAFPLVLESFAEGDTDTLHDLLAPKIYKAFVDVIDARKVRGETISTEIHSVRKLEIIEARLAGRMAYVTLRLTADETCVIKDAEKRIISGNPDRVTELTDVWTFGRNTASKDPTWLVFETRDDVKEAVPNPVPDVDATQ